MINIPTSPDRFSYYVKPVSNIIPCRTISLETIYNFISIEFLKSITRKVRSGEMKKFLALPFITSSGVFKRRSMDHLISYSGIISIDLDDVDIKLKSKLFEDPFLNPKLIFVSPSNKGLKLFIKVKNPCADHHDHYFNAISVYLLGKYRLKTDPACRDISRACFLCHDPEALYSETGSVNADTLLEMIPTVPCTDEQLRITPSPGNYRELNKFNGNATDSAWCVSAKNYSAYLMDKLNTCPQVHELAISILKQKGWTAKGKYWTRPGKNFKDGHSAVFSYFDPYGIFLFNNFSANALPILPNKAYSDCMLIATLEYNSDYNRCVAELVGRFKHLL